MTATTHQPAAGKAAGGGKPEDVATELLRRIGQRVTRPRVIVLARLVEARDAHLSAEEVLDRVQAQSADVHRATIYRTLESLTSAGVLHHVHLDRGLTAYHLSDAARADAHPHLHAQCVTCGTVLDLPSHVLGDSASRIAESTGFRLDASHVALSGWCQDCAATLDVSRAQDDG